METRTISEDQTLQDLVKSKLNSIQREVEELAVQFTLGKADAKDKFEEVKKELESKAHDLKREIDDISTFEVSDFLKSKIDELVLQLHLGKIETKEIFEVQMKKIRHAIAEVESRLREENIVHERIDGFLTDLEKFKLKSEIIGMKLQVKGIEMNDAFHNEMRNAKEYISKIFIKVNLKALDTKDKISEFNEEVKQTFEHLKSAVKSLGKN